MRNYSKIAAGLAGAFVAAAVAGGTPARAVPLNIDGYFYDLPAGSDKNLDAVHVLIGASDTLGMTRRGGACAANNNCLGVTTASHEYRASGTWNGAKADLVLINFDYRLPAIRVDSTAGKTETVQVAANGLTWDESTPGIFAKASTDTVASRLLPSYLLPHAVVYFGGLAADKITVATAGANKVLTIPLPAPFTGSNLVATIDPTGTPIHTQIAFNGKTYTGDFEKFSNDHADFHVYGPDHIVEKVDGTTTADLKVEYHWTDPYQTFPTPAQIATK